MSSSQGRGAGIYAQGVVRVAKGERGQEGERATHAPAVGPAKMKMRLALLALGLAGMLAAAPLAEAKISHATFKLSFSGTQQYSGSRHHIGTGTPCDPSVDSYSSERIRFRSHRAQRVKLRRNSYDDPGEVSGWHLVPIMRADGSVTRNGRNLIGPHDECAGGGAGGPPPKPDCGTIRFQGLRVSIKEALDLSDPPLTPLVPTTYVGLGTVYGQEDVFKHCPFGLYPYIEQHRTGGSLIKAGLSVGELFNRRDKKIVEKAEGTRVYRGEGRYETRVSWRIVLKRVRGKKRH